MDKNTLYGTTTYIDWDDRWKIIDAIKAEQDLVRKMYLLQRYEHKFGQAGSTLKRHMEIVGFRTGGHVPGYGGGDRVPAFLERGEFVVRKEVAKEYMPELQELNRSGLGLKNSLLFGKEGFKELLKGENEQDNERRKSQDDSRINSISRISTDSKKHEGRLRELVDLSHLVTIGTDEAVSPGYASLGRYNDPIEHWQSAIQSRHGKELMDPLYQPSSKMSRSTISPEAREFWRQLRFREDITDEQVEAINRHTGDPRLNYYLRLPSEARELEQEDRDDIANWGCKMLEVSDNWMTTEPTTLFRGASRAKYPDPRGIENYNDKLEFLRITKTGKFRKPYFTPTSVGQPFDGDVLEQYNVPAGTGVIPAMAIWPDQEEVVLPPAKMIYRGMEDLTDELKERFAIQMGMIPYLKKATFDVVGRYNKGGPVYRSQGGDISEIQRLKWSGLGLKNSLFFGEEGFRELLKGGSYGNIDGRTTYQRGFSGKGVSNSYGKRVGESYGYTSQFAKSQVYAERLKANTRNGVESMFFPYQRMMVEEFMRRKMTHASIGRLVSDVSDEELTALLYKQLYTDQFPELPNLLIPPFIEIARNYRAPVDMFQRMRTVVASREMMDGNTVQEMPAAVRWDLDSDSNVLHLHQDYDGSSERLADFGIHEEGHILSNCPLPTYVARSSSLFSIGFIFR